jgi:hypothetical protein
MTIVILYYGNDCPDNILKFSILCSEKFSFLQQLYIYICMFIVQYNFTYIQYIRYVVSILHMIEY